jgi:2-amino-4-hydroxy-6-hydroxymethyldihydropteridine diphosphokinase
MLMVEVTAYIGLGSNLGNPRQQVSLALTELDALEGCSLCRASSLYASPPMGPADQPDYVNAVAEINTSLEAEALLDQLQALEARHQREPTRRWGPRTLDLDLLSFSSVELSTDALTLPHPGIADRNFVLLPWSDIAPHYHVPGLAQVLRLAAVMPLEPAIQMEG